MEFEKNTFCDNFEEQKADLIRFDKPFIHCEENNGLDSNQPDVVLQKQEIHVIQIEHKGDLIDFEDL